MVHDIFPTAFRLMERITRSSRTPPRRTRRHRPRDLKPENIIGRADGRRGGRHRAVESGRPRSERVSRITFKGEVVGSASTCRPSMAHNADVGQSTDVWAIGRLFYWMLVGETPWRRPRIPSRSSRSRRARCPTSASSRA